MLRNGLSDRVNSCGLKLGQRFVNFHEEVEVLGVAFPVTMDIRHLSVDLSDHQRRFRKKRYVTPYARAQTAVATPIWGTDLTNYDVCCQWAARCANPVEIGISAGNDPEIGMVKNVANCACGLQCQPSKWLAQMIYRRGPLQQERRNELQTFEHFTPVIYSNQQPVWAS